MRVLIKILLGAIFLVCIVIGIDRLYARLTYVVPPPSIPREEVTITLIEGWTLRDVAEHLIEKKLATADEFFSFVGVPGHTSKKAKFRQSSLMREYPFLSEIPDGVSMEGYLFPDTYRVYVDEGVESIVRRLVDNFSKKVTLDLQTEFKKQHKKLYEIVTMASIIEREVATDDDRAKVSDILWGRLSVSMPLQVDSSVNYVTDKNTPAISHDDTRLTSPYNTYKFKGLPLGPISNPGIKSIEAAIYPEITPYVYFLTSKTGEVKYARTLDEHNANKWKYLK